jgi:hypothetical protein
VLWEAGAFAEAYQGNRDSVIDADPVADAVRSLMRARTAWTGNAQSLLGALNLEVGELAARSKTWPKMPNALAGRLRRAVTFLRKVGIDVTFDREGKERTRTIQIDRVGKTSSAPSAPSANEDGF